MAFGEPVLDYCERLDGGFWAEPLNAFSNAGFLIAAAAAYGLLRRRGESDVAAMTLIGVTASVGVGSFIFHTVATRGAMLLDVIPIAIFIYSYFLLALRRFFGVQLLVSAGITIAFAAASFAIDASFTGLNGSIAYLPALASLVSFSALLGSRDRESARGLALAASTFAVSLVFRTLDRDICGAFPYGAHFVWHALNAIVLWLLLATAINRGPAKKLNGSMRAESAPSSGNP